MKKIHIIPYICLFIAISTLFGCVDQSEKVQSLEDANEKLVLKNVTLEAALKTKEKNIEELQLTNKFLESKISKLQETDQNYFIAAVDLYKKADTLTQLGNTKKSFNDLIIKFPNSQLVDDSKKYINELDLKIGILESQNKFIKDFQDCISSKNWNQALSLLEDNRNILKESEYLEKKQLVDNEKNKPEEITINRLIYNFKDEYENSPRESFTRNYSAVYEKYKEESKYRVKFVGYFNGDYGVNRQRQSLRLRNFENSTGEDIEVIYKKTDKIDFFVDNNFQCKYNETWWVEIIGTTALYSNHKDIYINAESIKIFKVTK